jgi:hypothetical protein
MKFSLFVLLTAWCSSALANTPEISIPERDIALIKAADFVEITGTNDAGQPENFTIHDYKAIRQFVQLLTSDHYIAAPKSLKPQFKSLSSYQVRLSAKGVPLLELKVIAESVLDIPNDPSYYMQADEYSDDNLMAPLLRLR